MTNVTGVKVTITLELDEEQLRDLFEACEIRFSKAKVEKLDRELNHHQDGWFADVEETFEEIVGNYITDLFE